MEFKVVQKMTSNSKGGRKGLAPLIQFSARFPEEIFVLVRKVSTARGESPSTFIRRAVLVELAKLGYLDDREMKALGLREILIDNKQSGGDNVGK